MSSEKKGKSKADKGAAPEAGEKPQKAEKGDKGEKGEKGEKSEKVAGAAAAVEAQVDEAVASEIIQVVGRTGITGEIIQVKVRVLERSEEGQVIINELGER